MTISRDTLLKIMAISLILGVFAGMLGGIAALLENSNTTISPAIYCCAFIPFLTILVITVTNRKHFIILRKLKKSRIKKSKGEAIKMLELAKRFIDKDCIINLYDRTQVCGVIKEVTDNAMLIEEKGELIAINLEFVASIKEFPKNKNGKRKAIY